MTYIPTTEAIRGTYVDMVSTLTNRTEAEESGRQFDRWLEYHYRPAPKNKVHNHGPREGRGLDCPEKWVVGRLTGACIVEEQRTRQDAIEMVLVEVLKIREKESNLATEGMIEVLHLLRDWVYDPPRTPEAALEDLLEAVESGLLATSSGWEGVFDPSPSPLVEETPQGKYEDPRANVPTDGEIREDIARRAQVAFDQGYDSQDGQSALQDFDLWRAHAQSPQPEPHMESMEDILKEYSNVPHTIEQAYLRVQAMASAKTHAMYRDLAEGQQEVFDMVKALYPVEGDSDAREG